MVGAELDAVAGRDGRIRRSRLVPQHACMADVGVTGDADPRALWSAPGLDDTSWLL